MADPVTIGLVAMGAGAAMSAGGNIMGNLSQADQERKNADFLDEQAQFAYDAGVRSERVYMDEATTFKAQQVSKFAKAGIQIGTSQIDAIQETNRRIGEEVAAIRAERDMNVRTARLRAQAARDKADTLGSFGYNALTAGGGLLAAGGNIAATGAKGGKF